MDLKDKSPDTVKKSNKKDSVNILSFTKYKNSPKVNIIKDLLVSLSSNKNEKKIENTELDTILLSQKQNNWIRRKIETESMKDRGDAKKINDEIDKEIGEWFLKADKYSGEIYRSVGQLKSGVESAYLVASDILKILKSNEGLYFNSRIDALNAIDFVKIKWNDDGSMEDVEFIQVKSSDPESGEVENIHNKHREYFEKAKISFEEMKKKIDSDNEKLSDYNGSFQDFLWNILENESYVEKLLEFINDSNKFKKDKDYEKLSTIKSLIEKLISIKKDIELNDLICNDTEDGSWFFSSLIEENKILFIDELFNLVKDKYEQNSFMANNLFSADKFKSSIYYMDEKGVLVKDSYDKYYKYKEGRILEINDLT